MSEKLKKCPFCGDDAVKTQYLSLINTLFIRCLGCEIYMTTVNDSEFLADDRNEDLLTKKWNRRTARSDNGTSQITE